MNVKDHATLPTDLISYHRLEWDGVDATGHAHTGTLVNSPTQIYGWVQRALGFNGSNQYASIPTSAAYEVTTGITVGGWMCVGGTGYYSRKMVAKRNNTIIQWALEINSAANKFQFVITIGGSLYTLTDTDVFSVTPKWYHVVGRYNGTEASLWVNGVKKALQLVTGSINVDSSMPVLLGARCANGVYTPGAEYWYGNLDDIGIWGRGLTDAEIGDLYQSGAGIPYGDWDIFQTKKMGVQPRGNQEARLQPRSNFYPRTSFQTFQAHVSASTNIGGGTPQGLSPGILSIVALSATTIRVAFQHPATLNEALSAPGNYKITPTLAVLVVTPEAVSNPTYVDLDIDEQEDGILYQLELKRIIRA
jgi:hypothetical protein